MNKFLILILIITVLLCLCKSDFGRWYKILTVNMTAVQEKPLLPRQSPQHSFLHLTQSPQQALSPSWEMTGS